MTLESTPPNTADALAAAYAAFLANYPEYETTRSLDTLRQTEYGRLDDQDHVYLDYTGGGLYADAQVVEHMEMLRENVFGNPHSHNPTSLAMTERVEHARADVLRFFNAPPDEYVVIFTPNASGALKLVGESYPFGTNGRFALSADDHNSVNGIREFARSKGAAVDYVPLTRPDLRLDVPALTTILGQADPAAHNLFAFPAQSNYSGVKHPQALVAQAHAAGWDVLVDFAAYAPTNRLDLGRWLPDFATFSFYKMFGYPTGIGALLARRKTLAKLVRPWFAGGTIKIASVSAMGHYFADGEAAFEDGTVNYLTIPAVEIGMRHLDGIGMETITTRVRCLTGWLLEQLTALHHANGRRMVTIRGPETLDERGGTITISFEDPHGVPISGQLIEQLAGDERISLRTGCFCNPGAGETTFGLSKPEMTHYFKSADGLHFPELVDAISTERGIDVSAVRISVGLVSNFADVFRFMQFAETFRNRTADTFRTPIEKDITARDTA